MTCDEAVDLVVDSLMDSLDAEQQKRLAAHLESCESCAAEARAMGWTWEALSRLAAPEADPLAAAEFGTRSATAPTSNAFGPWLRAAAAIVLFVVGGAGGFWLRGSMASPAPVAGSTFLFLVRGDRPDATVPQETLVREYGAWATTLAGEGRLLGGEKLSDDAGRWVSEDEAEARTGSDVSGYFIIAASDYTQAVEIAKNSPHVRYGGTFEIRQIDPVN